MKTNETLGVHYSCFAGVWNGFPTHQHQFNSYLEKSQYAHIHRTPSWANAGTGLASCSCSTEWTERTEGYTPVEIRTAQGHLRCPLCRRCRYPERKHRSQSGSLQSWLWRPVTSRVRWILWAATRWRPTPRRASCPSDPSNTPCWTTRPTRPPHPGCWDADRTMTDRGWCWMNALLMKRLCCWSEYVSPVSWTRPWLLAWDWHQVVGRYLPELWYKIYYIFYILFHLVFIHLIFQQHEHA